MKRTEENLRNLWNSIKCSNLWSIGVSEEKEKKKGYEKYFEEIIVENFPNMEKEIVKEVQEAQKVPKQKLNTKKEYEKQQERSNK